MALTVGQKVIVKVTEWRQPVKYIEATVSKVGRKYFTLESVEHSRIHRTKFRNEDLAEVTEYGRSYCVYMSAADAVDEQLDKALADYLVKELSTGLYMSRYKPRVTTEKLVAMFKVLDPSCKLLQQLASDVTSIPGGREYLLEQYGINTEDS